MASKTASLSLSTLVATLLLSASIASADGMGGESISVPPPAAEVAARDTSADPGARSLCTRALTYDPDRPWRYDTEYLFPLTRQMSCSELPLAAQIVMYPFVVVVDMFVLPASAVTGLGGQ